MCYEPLAGLIYTSERSLGLLYGDTETSWESGPRSRNMMVNEGEIAKMDTDRLSTCFGGKEAELADGLMWEVRKEKQHV